MSLTILPIRQRAVIFQIGSSFLGVAISQKNLWIRKIPGYPDSGFKRFTGLKSSTWQDIRTPSTMAKTKSKRRYSKQTNDRKCMNSCHTHQGATWDSIVCLMPLFFEHSSGSKRSSQNIRCCWWCATDNNALKDEVSTQSLPIRNQVERQYIYFSLFEI